MTDSTKTKINSGLCVTVLTLIGIIAGAGVAWGAYGTRVARLENDIAELRPAIYKISHTLPRIEQMLRESERRLQRLEDRP